MEIEVDLRPVRAQALPLMDEVFLTGTTTDVQAITSIDERPIGDGHPGPLTLEILGRLRLLMGAIAT